jgi:CBS domain-containing protein
MGLVYEEVGVRALRVGDVMSTRVVAVTPGTPFRDVVELMLRHEISAVPVVDDMYGLVGLISEADLISKQAYGAAASLSWTGSRGWPGRRGASSPAAGAAQRARS